MADFASIKAATLAEPGARKHLKAKGIPLSGVAQNIAKRAQGGLARSQHHDLRLHGYDSTPRADRPTRRAKGGRAKDDTVNVVVASPRPGIAPPLGLMRPPVGPLAAPVASAERYPGAGRVGLPKGIDRNKPHATSGSPSYANGGCVSRGSSLADIRRKTQP